jgi:hypothetical protein
MNPVNLTFVPFSVVAVNPQPLPPLALVQFNPLPDVNNLPPGTTNFQNPIAINGSFQQTLAPSPAQPNTFPGHLSIYYNLQGTVSGTETAPAGPVAGSFSAMFNITGQVTGYISLPGSTMTSGSPIAFSLPWLFKTAITEQGTVSGPLNSAQASAMTTDTMTFSAMVGEKQTEFRFSPFAAAIMPWLIQTDVQAGGKFQVNVPAPSPVAITKDSVMAAFDVQDTFNSSLTTAATMPPPAIKIAGTDNASGTVAETVYTATPITLMTGSMPTVIPAAVVGNTQYHEALSETITYPPTATSSGSMTTLNQAFDTAGLYLYGELDTTTPTPVTPVDTSN